MAKAFKPLHQTPAPGDHRLLNRGDVLEFTLTLPRAADGAACLRTNLGHAQIHRAEIICAVEKGHPLMANDWHDLAMRKISDTEYRVTVPMLEVGRFEAKAFFLPRGAVDPIWPDGPNTIVKVEPAEFCAGNSVYTAFVRQFGPHKDKPYETAKHARAIETLDQAGYSVIPRSGTFRDLVRELDFIIGRLGARIIHLLPIHPIPTTFARMGRFGSPFAALDFMDVDHALAEFDRKTTPLEQFGELVDAIHERQGRVFLDIPVNHTGWASRLQIEHPEWFARDDRRMFQSPGAWGVTWEDLSKLDYRHRALWSYMAEVFLFWCRRGVDGFRCDAGYMVPFEVWQYVVARVRTEYPDTIFLLEGLGGKLEVMERLLADANLNWAYSELFQNYDRGQIEHFMPGYIRVSTSLGLLLHFAETHDNNRLAARSPAYARMRTALTALCSHDGGFGITNGVEWLADEKVDVHGAPSLHWGNTDNLVPHLARLNAILRVHPAFHHGADVRLVSPGDQNTVALIRRAGRHHLAVLANLNDAGDARLSCWTGDLPAGRPLWDLLSGREIALHREGDRAVCRLEPGEVLCLTADRGEVEAVDAALCLPAGLPDRCTIQMLKAKALEIYRVCHRGLDVGDVDPARLADELAVDPRACCRRLVDEGRKDANPSITVRGLFPDSNGSSPTFPPVVSWEWPRDSRRTVMIPPHHFLLIEARHPFSAELREGSRVLWHERSMPRKSGGHFALVPPMGEPAAAAWRQLATRVYEPGAARCAETRVLYLARGPHALARTSFSGPEVIDGSISAVLSNAANTLAQVQGTWGEVRSQYDSLLSANLHPDFPVDRQVLFPRCRTWLVHRGYSEDIDRKCLESFSMEKDGSVVWRFLVPVGQHKTVPLEIRLAMARDSNAVQLQFHRPKSGERSNDAPDPLDDSTAVKLILRPDLEDRNHHEKTKAYQGPGQTWAAATSVSENSFSFSPSGAHRLGVSVSPGTYVHEPEWIYMVPHPVEADRGLDGSTDLFSPGYFQAALEGGQTLVLLARAFRQGESAPSAGDRFPSHARAPEPATLRLDEAMRRAMDRFVVRRDDARTVIAGYPWFLDWGRDTLICLRGMIAAGMLDESRDILRQFARFERHGTIPNMIRGNDDSNRDTSDAPFWFLVACRDLLRKTGNPDFLSEPCGRRTLRDVIRSVAESCIKGTPNGIRMDPDSGLIFSPSHFTWMDTNFPACTPRQGYPIEIQALWHAGLSLLAETDDRKRWAPLAAQVCESIARLFRQDDPTGPYLSDCLHADPGIPAARARPDDALRPNQLLAITLGAVTDPGLCASILLACEQLLVPGAIRSLADRPVRVPIPARRDGHLLNDPENPYWGQYNGDEDTRRKPAYHNGTAWTWQFPSYAEALFMTHGEAVRETALAILGSSAEIINQGCMLQIPEILDGSSPHAARGCVAQAWGVTELYRMVEILSRKS